MAPESKDTAKAGDPTLGHALGAVAETALDQAQVLAIAQIDRWAEFLRQRLAVKEEEEPSAEPAVAAEPAPSALNLPDVAKPLIVGALAGAAVAWLFARRRTET